MFNFTGTVERLRSVGVCLPSSSTLYRKKSFGISTSGWDVKYVDQLCQAMELHQASSWSKYGLICFDEVKVKEGVIYNPHTGKLVGM